MPIKKDKKNYMGDLSDYLRKNVQKGYSLESLKWALVKQGNPRAEVEKAVAAVEKELPRLRESHEKPTVTLDQSSPVEAAVEVVPEKVPFWKRIFGG